MSIEPHDVPLRGRPPGARGRLEGKVALVVGAGSSGPGWGNGKATAVLFAREGARVVAVDREPAALAETVAVIEGEGLVVTAVLGDVGQQESCQAMVDEAVSAHGRLDILHNNVGILRPGDVLSQQRQDWDDVLRINLTGTYLTCAAAIPAMLAGGGGSIVNVASVAGIRHLGSSYASYSASKAGILALTQTTAVEFAGRGIRVNAVLPGFMDTPMVFAGPMAGGGGSAADQLRRKRNEQVPMGHMGDAWDVAYAALFLASDESRYVTGTHLVVDGGLTAKC